MLRLFTRPVCALALATLVASTAPAGAQPLAIAAASDLQGVLPEVATQYQRQTGRPVRLTFGSSGNFFAQIQNGAPFDLFMSADIDYPRQLANAGLAEPGTLYQYATGRLVLWTLKSKASAIRVGLPGLLDPAVRRIAIANPAHAPYGRAAIAALQNAGIYDQVQTKLVFGENVSQAAQFVDSGNADVGILAQSLALLPTLSARGTLHQLPTNTYPPIDQAAVVLKTAHVAEARQFLAFLATPGITGLMQRFGFDVPPPSR